MHRWARLMPREGRARALGIALLFFFLGFVYVPPSWTQERGEPARDRISTLALPARFTERFGSGWAEDFREAFLSAGRQDALSGLALSVTLGSIRLDQLPVDAKAAALFCVEVAGVADVALRSGYSPTLLAADVRQVLRKGGSPSFGPSLLRGPRLIGERPIVRGPLSPPGPALRGGQNSGIGFSGGFGPR